MKEIDNFYLKQDEPIKSCFLALKQIILSQDPEVTNEWKYKIPVFCYKGKMFCYLWYHKKHKQPYLGIVEGHRFDEPFLMQEKRARMKIMLLDPNEDLPVESLNKLLTKALSFYKSGEIKTKK